MFWSLQDGQKCAVQSIDELHGLLRELCSFRYAYIGTPGSMEEDFGGTNETLPECLIRPSLHYTAALWYVTELTSMTNQKHRLQSVKACMLPPPMYNFMCQEAPGIQEFWDAKEAPCMTRPEWSSTKAIKVKKWGAITSHQEAMASKMYI